MILRIVLGRFPPDKDAVDLLDLRDRLTRSARSVNGLESLMIGARRATVAPADDRPDDGADDGAAGLPPIEAAIVTVWADAESMVRATGVDEQHRFIAGRLDLPFTIDRTDHYEITGRTFAAMPSETIALMRILTVRARPHEEVRLVETLRNQQPRLVELGLVASHLGRRVASGGEVEAVYVGVWPDRATVRQATGGRTERPLFESELADWADGLHLEMFDGIEIAPRLPAASGPPLLIVDEDMRIVDITASAAAALGLPAREMVGRRVDELVQVDEDTRAELWHKLLETGTLIGETPWSVPDVGSVLIRYVVRFDVPIDGRHAVLVRRHREDAPTVADLDAALADAFPNARLSRAEAT